MMQLRYQPLLISLVCSTSFFCFFTLVTGSVAAVQQIPERDLVDAQTLQTTPGLRQILQANFHEERLDSVLKTLSQETGVRISVTTTLAPRKLTAHIKNKSAASLLIEIQRVLGISCRRLADGFELFQTEVQQRAEMRWKRLSAERETDFLHRQTEALRAQIADALAEKGGHRDLFADYLAHCDPSVLESGLPSALEDEPILSASDQSHFHNHLFGVMPFAALAPAQQSAVSQIAREGGFAPLTGSSGVGLIAAAGGFRLGIVQPDGKDVWVAPTHAIGGVAGLNANSRENDFDPGVIRQLESDKIADLAALPGTIGQKQFIVTAAHAGLFPVQVVGGDLCCRRHRFRL